MSKSAHLRLRDLRAVFELVNECRDLGDDPVGWRRHCYARLGKLTGADLIVGGELTGLQVGAPRDLGNADWGWEHGFNRGGWLRALELLQTDPTYSPILGQYARRMAREDGIALAKSELADERTWQRSTECQQVFRTIGVDHTVYCFRTVPGTGADVSGSILARAAGQPDFSPRAKLIVQEAHAMLAPLVGGALARFDEPSPTALPARVRQVLACLLEGDGDKQIAVRLGLSAHTVNEYVKRIFTHFRVASRPELLARWVRRGWGQRGPGWAGSLPPVEPGH